MGRGKHYSPPQLLHSYRQARGQNVFWWPKDHFRSIRVYNLTASRLDSPSVCKYCTDMGRHLPLSARETKMPACRPSARPRGLSLLPGTAPWLNLTSWRTTIHTTRLQQGNATLGKLTLILDDLNYKPLLNPWAITFTSSPSRCPQHSRTVSPDALTPQEEFVFSLSRQSWRLDTNIFCRETDFVCCFPVLSVGHCCAQCQGWGSKRGPTFLRAVCSKLYSHPEYLQ